MDSLSQSSYTSQSKVKKCYELLESSEFESLTPPRRFLIDTLKNENKEQEKKIKKMETPLLTQESDFVNELKKEN